MAEIKDGLAGGRVTIPSFPTKRESLATQTFAVQRGLSLVKGHNPNFIKLSPSTLGQTLLRQSQTDTGSYLLVYQIIDITIINWHYNNWHCSNVMGKSWCFTWACEFWLYNFHLIKELSSLSHCPWHSVGKGKHDCRHSSTVVCRAGKCKDDSIPLLCRYFPLFPLSEWFGKLWLNCSVTVCSLLKIISTE